MMREIKQVIYKYKGMILIALAFLITGAFVVLRNVTGFGPILVSGVVLYCMLWSFVRSFKRLKWTRVLSNFMAAVFILGAISFAFIELAVITGGKSGEAVHGDYVIVLGAGLKGEKPSVSLSSRLQKASEYLEQSADLKVIVSGGQGKGEHISEAEAMERYLISRGIEEKRILKEEHSTSTRENLLFSKAMLDAIERDKAYSVIVITSDYHIFRTKILARNIGLDMSGLPAKTPLYVYISGCIREYFAIVDTYLFN